MFMFTGVPRVTFCIHICCHLWLLSERFSTWLSYDCLQHFSIWCCELLQHKRCQIAEDVFLSCSVLSPLRQRSKWYLFHLKYRHYVILLFPCILAECIWPLVLYCTHLLKPALPQRWLKWPLKWEWNLPECSAIPSKSPGVTQSHEASSCLSITRAQQLNTNLYTWLIPSKLVNSS